MKCAVGTLVNDGQLGLRRDDRQRINRQRGRCACHITAVICNLTAMLPAWLISATGDMQSMLIGPENYYAVELPLVMDRGTAAGNNLQTGRRSHTNRGVGRCVRMTTGYMRRVRVIWTFTGADAMLLIRSRCRKAITPGSVSTVDSQVLIRLSKQMQ
jgi:hypothetical protein